MARGDQLVRQWGILHRLRRGRCSRRALAEEFDVSLKTIARDIDALSLFPITEEREGIDVMYRLIEDSQAPGLWFSAEEVVTLLFAGDMVAKTLEKTPYFEAFTSILEKVKSHQKGQTYRKIHRFPEVFQVYSSSERTRRRISEEQLSELIHAAADQRKIWIKYFTVSRQVETERVVEPFVIYQSPHGFRLVAYCHLRDDVRMFSINQIREQRLLDEHFDLEARRFDLESYLLTSFHDMGGEPIVDVKLHVGFPSASWARDRVYHPTQEITDVDDGIIITFRSGGLPAIAATVLGIGIDCRALEPPILREMVAQRARQIASYYDE